MTDEKLRADLERLRGEVSAFTPDKSGTREKLNAIIADIENHMQEPDDVSTHYGLLDDIRSFVGRFETENPRATAILNDIMVTLSNMGI